MNVYDFTVTDNKGEAVSLRQYEGKALLIVNTATHCGFTPQYEGLQRLYETYCEQGFEILDFLIDRNGEPVARFASADKPERLEHAVMQILCEPYIRS